MSRSSLRGCYSLDALEQQPLFQSPWKREVGRYLSRALESRVGSLSLGLIAAVLRVWGLLPDWWERLTPHVMWAQSRNANFEQVSRDTQKYTECSEHC